MQLFATDFFDASMVLKNLTFLLLVAAMGMPTLFLVRVVALAAGAVGLVYSAFIIHDLAGIFWYGFLLLMIVVQLLVTKSVKFGRRLTPEEKLFHQKAVPMLSVAQARMLLTAGQWKDWNPGAVLTRQGDSVMRLFFIASGTVDIVVDDAKVAEVGPGELIGEIGISTGDVATATALCATKVRSLVFDADRLYGLLDGRTDLLIAVETALQSSLRAKLQRANAAVAHPGAVHP